MIRVVQECTQRLACELTIVTSIGFQTGKGSSLVYLNGSVAHTKIYTLEKWYIQYHSYECHEY